MGVVNEVGQLFMALFSVTQQRDVFIFVRKSLTEGVSISQRRVFVGKL